MMNDKNSASLATYVIYKTRSSLHCTNNHYIMYNIFFRHKKKIIANKMIYTYFDI